MQQNFATSCRMVITIATTRFRGRLVTILYYLLKYFSAGNVFKMGEKEGSWGLRECMASVMARRSCIAWGLSFVTIDVCQLEWSPKNLVLMNVRITTISSEFRAWKIVLNMVEIINRDQRVRQRETLAELLERLITGPDFNTKPKLIDRFGMTKAWTIQNQDNGLFLFWQGNS
jgi:hypothetical protein